MDEEGSGYVVGEARVRLRPSTVGFGATAAAEIEPQLAAVEGKVVASGGRINAALAGVSRNLGSLGIPFAGALDSVDRSLQKTAGNAEGLAAKVSSFGAAEVVALGVVAVAGVHMAMEQEEAHARLENAIGAVHEKYGALSEQVEDTDSRMRKLGFTDMDTEGSTAKLTLATKDAHEALNLEGLAADISRGRKMALSSATDLLVKVETGHVGLLGRLGIATKDATGHTISQEEAIRRLTEMYGGSAQRYAHTFAGELRVIAAEGERIGVVVGEAVIPVITGLGHAVTSGISGFESLNEVTDGWLGKLTALGLAIPIAVFAGQKLWSLGGLIVNQYGKVIDRLGSTADAMRGTSSAQDALAASTVASNDTVVAAEAARVTSESTVAEAIAARVAIQEAATVADTGQVASDAEVITATSLRVAAEQAEWDAQAKLLEAHALSVNAQAADATAGQALAVVQDELTGSYELTEAAIMRLNAATATKAATDLAATAADEAEMTAEGQLAAAIAVRTAAQEAEAGAQLGTGVGAALEGAGGSMLLTAGAATVMVAAGVGLAVALRSIGSSAYLSDGQMKNLNADLLKGGEDAEKAKGKYANVIGSDAANGLKHYSDLLLSGADAKSLDAQKSKIMQSALDKVTDSFHLSGSEAKRAQDGYLNMGEGAASLQFKLGATRQEVDKAVGSLDALNKKYGASAVQSAELQAAEKKYADLLAGGTASSHQLAVARQAVVDINGRVSKTQAEVNAALAQGQAPAQAATTATEKYNALLQQFERDASSGHVAAGTLAKDWQAVAGAVVSGTGGQSQMHAVLAALGVQATITAGDVVSLAMAEQALGNFSANAVASYGNITQAAGEQYEANQKVSSSTDSYNQAVDDLHKAQNGGGSGGGGAAGATKDASEQMLTQERNALSLRDALKQEAAAARTIVTDEQALAQAHRDAGAATTAENVAHRNLELVLHGYAASSKQAQDATEGEAKAHIDLAGRILDERDAEQALSDAKSTAATDAATSQANIASAEAALDYARSRNDPLAIAVDEKNLADTRTAAATLAKSDQEKVDRANLALKSSKWAVHDASVAENAAQRELNGTLHGFPATSAEAKSALDQYNQSKKDAKTATDAVTQAEISLSDAQDQTATTALAVRDAQHAILHQFDQTPGSAGTAIAAFDNVQTKMGAVETAAKQLALDTGAAVTQATGDVGQGILAYVTELQRLTAANPLLKGAFQDILNNLEHELQTGVFGLVVPPTEVNPGGGGPKPVIGGKAPGAAAIGADLAPGEWSTAGEGTATELLHAKPQGGVEIFSHDRSVEMADKALTALAKPKPTKTPEVAQRAAAATTTTPAAHPRPAPVEKAATSTVTGFATTNEVAKPHTDAPVELLAPLAHVPPAAPPAPKTAAAALEERPPAPSIAAAVNAAQPPPAPAPQVEVAAAAAVQTPAPSPERVEAAEQLATAVEAPQTPTQGPNVEVAEQLLAAAPPPAPPKASELPVAAPVPPVTVDQAAEHAQPPAQPAAAQIAAAAVTARPLDPPRPVLPTIPAQPAGPVAAPRPVLGGDQQRLPPAGQARPVVEPRTTRESFPTAAEIGRAVGDANAAAADRMLSRKPPKHEPVRAEAAKVEHLHVDERRAAQVLHVEHVHRSDGREHDDRAELAAKRPDIHLTAHVAAPHLPAADELARALRTSTDTKPTHAPPPTPGRDAPTHEIFHEIDLARVLGARPQPEITPAPLHHAPAEHAPAHDPGRFPTAEEIAHAIAPLLKRVDLSGSQFVAIDPEELAADVSRQIGFDLIGKL